MYHDTFFYKSPYSSLQVIVWTGTARILCIRAPFAQLTAAVYLCVQVSDQMSLALHLSVNLSGQSGRSSRGDKWTV